MLTLTEGVPTQGEVLEREAGQKGIKFDPVRDHQEGVLPIGDRQVALSLSASLALGVVLTSLPRWTVWLLGYPVCGLPRRELTDHGRLVRVSVGTDESQAEI